LQWRRGGLGVAALATPYLLALPHLPSGDTWRTLLGVCVAPLMLGAMMLLTDRSERESITKQGNRVCRMNPGGLQVGAPLLPWSGVRRWFVERAPGNPAGARLVIDLFGDAVETIVLPDAETARDVEQTIKQMRPDAQAKARRASSAGKRGWRGWRVSRFARGIARAFTSQVRSPLRVRAA